MPELSDVYDPSTVAAIDDWHGSVDEVSTSVVRRGAAAGALVTALTLGMRDEPSAREPVPVVLEVDWPG